MPSARESRELLPASAAIWPFGVLGMSIRFRLNALFMALLSLALISFVLVMVVSAGPRIHAENDSIMRLAREFVETTIESLQGTTDPGARLAVLLDGLKDLRHVRIYRAGDREAERYVQAPAEGDAPEWLSDLAEPSPGVQIPVRVNGRGFRQSGHCAARRPRGGGDLGIYRDASRWSAAVWPSPRCC